MARYTNVRNLKFSCESEKQKRLIEIKQIRNAWQWQSNCIND